ncbi:MAG TPA: indolepyruvate ferredoxin oxidoreductase family protein [Acetobacteraceae bacterium]|nr:indolepyruvate ferredoxin oxidoreductase family protein [Acetobacteraceae bacterium]
MLTSFGEEAVMDTGVGLPTKDLESRFADLDAPVLLSGIQALVRVLLEQARLDRAAGHSTAGLVSGYRGSPLGGLDMELWREARRLEAENIRFQPGLNEDLAATMLWGAQQIDVFPAGKRFEGVFGLWYGKGPGVERSGDALHAANMIGTSALGGVLAVSGDDHAAHSSTYPHQSEAIFHSAMIPVLVPADVGDILDFGLTGLALSRFAGCWAAMKTIAETAEQSATLVLPRERRFRAPDFPTPPHGLNLDPVLPWPERRAELERRVVEERLPAALAFARANGLDRVVMGGADAPIGLVTVGKAHHDAMHALAMLGFAADPRIAVYKLGLAWPVEGEGLRRFAAGKRAILVVEEKRGFVEVQVRDALYNLAADRRPVVAGKRDEDDAPLLPAVMELSPEILARALARFLRRHGLAVADPVLPAPPERPEGLLFRIPTFCAGCPHNTSTTKLPEGSFAAAGIGCHTMAIVNGGPTRSFTHMGGEGITWVGLAPFVTMPHLFANMGDGTYQHSGILAIRQAVAAKTPITYKLLYNDAVAMTGGQPVEGHPTVVQIARQLAAEGVRRIAVVADDEARLPRADDLPEGATRHGRAHLDAVQRALRDFPGVSVLIYDQVCATEKRRRRKRGRLAEAERSVLINPEVCENCGDCSTKSHCIAIEPVETKLGRKRRISPTACNEDYSCLKGFCPSFVTIAGAHPEPARPPVLAREAELSAALAEPAAPAAQPWRALFAGIGGGGVVTSAAIVAMAAHLEGRAVRTLSFTGLAQKNGPVISHVQLAESEAALDVVRIPLGTADFMLAADLAVGASGGVLDRCAKGAAVIGNLDLQATAEFLRARDLPIDAERHRRTIARATDAARSRYVRAGAIAERLFGTAQALNTLLLGLAWQRGLVPVRRAAIERAVALNGAAVAMNRSAFLWGRILAERPELAGEILGEESPLGQAPLGQTPGFEEMVAARAASLVAYQGEALARRYRALVGEIAEREAAIAGADGALARAVAENYHRVLAYKDEYEVARLHAAATYGEKPVFHLSPPLPLGRDPATGRRRKIALPGWAALPLFRALRHGKVLRGTKLDPFGWQKERGAERQMIRDYESDLETILRGLGGATLGAAVALAEWPARVRGFGPVKEVGRVAAMAERAALLASFAAPPTARAAA